MPRGSDAAVGCVTHKKVSSSLIGARLQVCAVQLLMMINAVRDNLCLMTGSLDLAPAPAALRPVVEEILAGLQPAVRKDVNVCRLTLEQQHRGLLHSRALQDMRQRAIKQEAHWLEVFNVLVPNKLAGA